MGTSDSPEQIQKCLSCERTDCVDCIGRKQTDDGVRINNTARQVLHFYKTAKDDMEISKATGIPRSTIQGIRKKFSLPPIKKATAEERTRMVDRLLGKGVVVFEKDNNGL